MSESTMAGPRPAGPGPAAEGTTVRLFRVEAAEEEIADLRRRIAGREIRGEWLLALSGGLSMLFGILLIIWPGAGALTLVVLIGAYAVVFGCVLVGLGLRLRRVGGQAAVVGRRGTA